MGAGGASEPVARSGLAMLARGLHRCAYAQTPLRAARAALSYTRMSEPSTLRRHAQERHLPRVRRIRILLQRTQP